MTSTVVAFGHPYGLALTVIDSVVTKTLTGASDLVGSQVFATDPVGSFYLTLNNVVVGSRVHVEKLSDGTEYYDGVATASTVEVSLNAYASGNASNDLRIKVRKGSASPKYQPFETYATAVVGSQSVYIAQIPDPIAA